MTGDDEMARTGEGVVRTEVVRDLAAVQYGRWRVPPAVLLTIIGAWVLAVAAETTGRGELIHHHQLVDGTLPSVATLALFLVAWQAHVAAMMLPSSVSLIELFGRAAARQPRPHVVRAVFLGGYFVIWTLFGLTALAGDAVLHLGAARWAWLADQPQLVGGGVLLVAGAFQFTDLEDRCLRQCRHPALFLAAHYDRGLAAAFRLGRRHGLYCLGCCWALMLVMFAVGIANLAWMAPLTLLMVFEKAAPGGDRTRPVGIGLLVLGVLVLVDPAWLPELPPATGPVRSRPRLTPYTR